MSEQRRPWRRGSAVLNAPARRVLFAGGYTAGHVTVGLAVAEQLRDLGFGVDWAGEGPLERRLSERAGISFHRIPAAPLVGRGLGGRMAALARLPVSALQAARLIRQLGVDVVVGTGGFVSAPCVLGAWITRRPALLIEPNGESGLANRWLSPFAREAAVCRRDAARRLRCPSTVTGVPIRARFGSAARPLPAGRTRVLALGGSLGAPPLQEAMVEALGRLREPPIDVIHQTGAGEHEATLRLYRSRGTLRGEGRFRCGAAAVEVVPFLEDLASELARAHLVVTPAGAATVAEVCGVGRASVLVPLEVAGAHQRSNAAPLEAAGAAVVLGEDRLGSLGGLLAELLADRRRLERMGGSARSLAEEAAARRVAERVLVWSRQAPLAARGAVPRSGSPDLRGELQP